jgi:hypothetical protein
VPFLLPGNLKYKDVLFIRPRDSSRQSVSFKLLPGNLRASAMAMASGYTSSRRRQIKSERRGKNKNKKNIKEPEKSAIPRLA